jgi:hypothetical protein
VTAVPNPFLREHVTSTAFALNLGKTHVAALVRLDLELAAEVQIHAHHIGPDAYGRLHRNDVTGRSGLISRGLLVHVAALNEHKYVVKKGQPSIYRVGAVDYDRMPIGECWNITRAGRLVIELLQEAGLYQEFAGPLLPLIEAQRARKRERVAS